MNTFDTRESETQRSSFEPQRPHRAPWVVICTLCATLAFLAGHALWHTSSVAPGQLVSVAPHQQGKQVYPFSKSENPVADIVSSVEPSVVSIDTTIKADDPDLDLKELLQPKSGSSHPLFKDPSHYEAHGSGSGVIVRSDGYILTNNHVVKGAEDIKVTLNNGRVFTGHVIGRDNYTDIAVVKIPTDGLPVAPFAESKGVRPGDWAIAIGTPLGLSHTVTMGIVSAVGRSLADLNNNVDLIQTDAAINPGNSGGPLLNIEGQVIGINMAIRTDAQNIGFSIPADVARDAANSILANRPILHPYLGISMMDYDAQVASVIGLSSNLRGVVVSKVLDSSPAASSGISAGDLIESVNNEPVSSSSDVQKIVRAHKVGQVINLRLVHEGKTENVDVTLTAYPQTAEEG